MAEQVGFEQLQHDQLDLEVHALLTFGLQKVLTQHGRPQRIIVLIQRQVTEGCKALGQLAKRHLVTRHDLRHHRVNDLRAHQVIGQQRERALGGRGAMQGALTDIRLGQAGKRVKKTVQESAFDVFALEPDIAHGLKKQALLGVAAGVVSHGKQGFVGVVEQHLQAALELLRGLVMDLQQNDRQACERRMRRQLRYRLVGSSHFPVIVHPSLLERCVACGGRARDKAAFDARKQKPASPRCARRKI